MRQAIADVRFAFRLLGKSPGFTIVAVLALALGIGANSAIFTAIDRILLRPLPYHDADRLVFVWEDATHVGFPRNTPAPGNFNDWKSQNQVFTDMAAARYRAANLTGVGPPELVFGRGVTPNLFSVLGVKPVLGRTFTAQEEKAQAPVVVISHALWQRRFGGESVVIGKRIQMDGKSHEVIGIMPQGFHFPERTADFWMPTNFTPQQAVTRNSHFLNVVARLKPGVSHSRAQSDMSAIAKRLQDQYPDSNAKVGAVVVSARDQVVGTRGTGLWVLMTASACVLLIACANIANLLLARAASREREMAVRSALGARRIHLVRQSLTEGLLLSLSGGFAGLLVGEWGIQVMEKFIPDGLGGSEHLAIDGTVLAFTFAVAVLTGILFSVAPALHSARVPVNETLKEGSRGNVHAGSLFRNLLVVAEVGLAVVLLVGAGLMIQTLANLRKIQLGFDSENMLTMRTVLSPERYKEDSQRVAFYENVLQRVRTLPGVESAAFSSNLPFTAMGNTTGYKIEGRPDPPPGVVQDTLYREVTTSYFETLRAQLHEGRFFQDSDTAKTVPVVVINRVFSALHWPNESPLGKRIFVGGEKAPFTIVGVVEDLRERGIGPEMKPAAYLPIQQVTRPETSFLAVRTSVRPDSLISAVRVALWSIDSQQPIFEVRTMNEILDLAVSDRKHQMTLLGAFAALALILASIGIYGVLSYTVALRRREIGVRMALGATASKVLQSVLRYGLGLTAAGVLTGIAVSFAATRLMQSILYGVASSDPSTYLWVAAILIATAFVACLVPAWRAAAVDPIVTLRDE